MKYSQLRQSDDVNSVNGKKIGVPHGNNITHFNYDSIIKTKILSLD